MADSSAANICRCCYPVCELGKQKGVIGKSDGRVEVRGFEPPLSERSSLKFRWGSGGRAEFHIPCWRMAVQMSKVENPADNSPFELSSLEQRMVKEARKTAEYHDSDSVVDQEAGRIAKLLCNAKYGIAFTGAGISTAAGIGDFRGKDGKWTEMDKRKTYGAQPKASRGYSIKDLRPTYTHEAIVKLLEMGLIKYVISQNTDGLHRLSGVPAHSISELHGNAFLEKCEDCNTWYDKNMGGSRSTHVSPLECPQCHINHRTGRMCTKSGCKGYLMNTIINFGDNLMEDVLGSASNNALASDLVLCLGTTLRVSPANSLVMEGKKPTRLIICNRQKTPSDEICTNRDEVTGESFGSRVFGDCDRLMRRVMVQVLQEEDLKTWEEEREKRLKQYDQLRN